jgi:hypothetical protein
VAAGGSHLPRKRWKISQVEELAVMFVLKEFQHESEAFDDRFLFVGPSFLEGAPEPWPFETDSDDKHRRAYGSPPLWQRDGHPDGRFR